MPNGRELIASPTSRVFLTNQYDDDLDGLDTALYTPCLRCEPFVTGMDTPSEREAGHLLGAPYARLGM